MGVRQCSLRGEVDVSDLTEVEVSNLFHSSCLYELLRTNSYVATFKARGRVGNSVEPLDLE